jgi:hypothetical protein
MIRHAYRGLFLPRLHKGNVHRYNEREIQIRLNGVVRSSPLRSGRRSHRERSLASPSRSACYLGLFFGFGGG